MNLSKITSKDAKAIVAMIENNVKRAKQQGQHDLVKIGQDMLDTMPREIRELLKGGH